MIRYVLFAPLSLLANLLVILTSPLWAAWAATGKLSRLPGPFAYLHTHDDDIYGSKTTGEGMPKSWAGRWKRAAWWLCRNPAYGLDAYVFGVPEGEVEDVSVKGEVEDGERTRLTLRDGSTRFGWRRDLFYGKARYCKMWFGWASKPKAGAYMLKFDINPFKKAERR